MPVIRIFREFKAHIVRYLILIVILAASLSLVEGNVMSSSSIEDQMNDYFKEFHAEDGEFVTFTELSSEQENELTGKNIDLQRMFYSDYDYGDDAVVRIYKTRDEINKINVINGEEPNAWNEVFVENRFAKANNISTGDVLSVAGNDLTVTGIGTVPDYVSVKKNRTDIRTDDKTFGVLFVNQDTYQTLLDTGSAIQNEVHEYAYILNGDETTNDLKNYLNDQEVPEFLSFQNIDSILISITDVNDNERMTGYKTDVDTNLSVSILLACLLAVLIAFIIAVFMMHTIDQESSEIGTLYALGVKRSEIKRQYVLLPVFVLIIGGVVGTLFGMFMNGIALENVAQSYSFPEITARFYPIALLYGIVMPVVFGYIINTLILNRKLRQEPLDLLRRANKKVKPSKVKINSRNFNRIYLIRQILREKFVYIVLFVGVFYALCILIFAFNVYSGLNNYVENSIKDVNWNYMYSLNSMPENKADFENQSEEAVVKSVSAYNKYAEKEVDVTLVGLNENSEYFDFDVTCDKDEIKVSSCAAKKFDWKKGDTITLNNNKDDSKHKYKIEDVVQYSASLLVFMPENEVKQIYEFQDDYYNTLFSEEELTALSPANIQGVTKRNDIQTAGEALMDSMWSVIWLSLAGSVIVFIAVLYLLLRHVIDKSSFAVSLMRIFGYRDRELNRIFINPNFFIVLAAALLAILWGKPFIDSMYPTLITDIDIGLSYEFTPVIYVLIVLIIAAGYFVSTLLLQGRLKRMDATEVLKNRE